MIKKKLLTIAIVLSSVLFLSGRNSTKNSELREDKGKVSKSNKVNESQQQEEFLKIYNTVLLGIKASNTMFYTSHNLLTRASRADTYELLKTSEERHGELSANFYQMSAGINNTHPSLKEYRQDMAQSFDELATVCAHRQTEAKYLADYINTGDLESYRKTKEEMEGTGEILSNAISRLVFGVGEKLNMDTQSLENEYARINAEVKQEFEDRFGE